MTEQQENFHAARELFAVYVDIFNGEFHDIASAEEARQRSLSIATDLLEIGFIIRTRIHSSVKTINPTEGTLQTVITIRFNMALVEREKEMDDPLMVGSAISHIFGPPTAPTEHEHIEHASPEDEAWLRNTLDSMKSQLLSAWSTRPTDTRNQEGT